MENSRKTVIKTIESLDIKYDLIDIDPEYADTAVFCGKYGYPLEYSANTIIVASKREPKKFFACLVLASTKLDVNKKVRKLMGVSKASFASTEEMKKITGMEIGGVTPFSLPDNMPLFVDERIMELEWIIFGG